MRAASSRASAGKTRYRIAALDATRDTNNATSWSANTNNTVLALALSGTTIYAGGDFTSLGGQLRNHIAALDASTGAATSWNPNADSAVCSLAVSGTNVYAGGYFAAIGGKARYCIAALNASTGDATDWNPGANHPVYLLAVLGMTVYAGGDFEVFGLQERKRLAALDAMTGAPTGWYPYYGTNSPSPVCALAASMTRVYVGGLFNGQQAYDYIGGQPRKYIAALNTSSGDATSWDPNANGAVIALAVSGATVYAGGYFDIIGGQTRNYIAALDATRDTNNATSWDPNADNFVAALAVSGTTVYAGGNFMRIAGQARKPDCRAGRRVGHRNLLGPERKQRRQCH